MISLPRLTKRGWIVLLHDALASGVAMILSLFLRLGEDGFLEEFPLLFVLLPYFVLLSAIVCYLLKLPLSKWRFTSLPDILTIIRISTILSIVLLGLDFAFLIPRAQSPFFLGNTTIVIYWLLEIALLSGSRLIYRYYRFSRTRLRRRFTNAAPALLVGVAADAELLIRSSESGAIGKIWPVALLSPSRADQGQMIREIPVLGGIDDLANVINVLAGRGQTIERIVMTSSALLPENKPEQVIREARKLGISVNRLPSLEDGREAQLTPVAVEDLLLRPTVRINYSRLEELIKGKRIVVTGGGGSIGAEICHRVVAFGASKVLILENSEPALYLVLESLKGAAAEIDGRIADIRDRVRIMTLLAEFQPDIVFHAAALKHVPILERDFNEAIKTNIFGTVNVADAARMAGARAMVMISTDKAIAPVSMLGLTKRFAEMYCQALDADLRFTVGTMAMRLISVRFGNVLASNGSVVPKFKAQIEAGGPVTVTHPDMVRYFMTIREACDLVITAASHALASNDPDVSVYVLNMGQPVRIAELAERLITLSGLVPGEDIEIVYTGIRPGERLHEILFTDAELSNPIGVEGVMAAKASEVSFDRIQGWIKALGEVDEVNNFDRVKAILYEAIPELREDVQRV